MTTDNGLQSQVESVVGRLPSVVLKKYETNSKLKKNARRPANAGGYISQNS